MTTDNRMELNGEHPSLSAIAAQFEIQLCDRVNGRPWDDFLKRFPIHFCRQHGVLALEPTANETLPVMIGDPKGVMALDTIRRSFGRSVQPLFVHPAEVQNAINTAYESQGGKAKEVVDSIAIENEASLSEMNDDLLDSSGRAPVIQLVNQILFEAIKSRASDIHIQPSDSSVVARFRIDGVLFNTVEIPKPLQDEVVSRIKVLGNMNVAEKRLPQDGRATVRIADRVIDLRIASLPTSHSERVVIRLLDKSARLYTMTDLGMPTQTRSRFENLISLEHGLLLVTGPTGSGKSTTLYAALQQISTEERNVVTLEDPIEYELDGVSQTQINEKKGLTFARGLRNVLRQDPDIIMVGEVRDKETAVMAIQSSLTGHLVFSTLHTNDSASAVTRLLDLGIEPYLVSSSLMAVLAQRLVRRICPACRIEVEPDRTLYGWLESSSARIPETVYEGKGCDSCRGTGFSGRVGIYELLTIDEPCRRLIQDRENASRIREHALAAGMTLLAADGLCKVEEGKTTLGEVVRVAQRSSD
ncbi:MAG: ATPase, T2SS/T4P/T4SS family [Planctomycetota bacterium]